MHRKAPAKYGRTEANQGHHICQMRMQGRLVMWTLPMDREEGQSLPCARDHRCAQVTRDIRALPLPRLGDARPRRCSEDDNQNHQTILLERNYRRYPEVDWLVPSV